MQWSQSQTPPSYTNSWYQQSLSICYTARNMFSNSWRARAARYFSLKLLRSRARVLLATSPLISACAFCNTGSAHTQRLHSESISLHVQIMDSPTSPFHPATIVQLNYCLHTSFLFEFFTPNSWKGGITEPYRRLNWNNHTRGKLNLAFLEYR